MLRLLKLIFGVLVRSFRARRDLLLENLALRQQLCALARRLSLAKMSSGLSAGTVSYGRSRAH
jgi:hypothetical protein